MPRLIRPWLLALAHKVIVIFYKFFLETTMVLNVQATRLRCRHRVG